MTAELLLIAAINFCTVFTDPVERQLCVYDLNYCFREDIEEYDYIKKNPIKFAYILPIKDSNKMASYQNCFVFTDFSKIKSQAKKWRE